MDFKGHFAMHAGRCHPLTVLDDHSRYLVGLRACGNEQTATVQGHLTELFTVHGLPGAILCDNGSPWAGAGSEHSVHRTLKADLLARYDWPDLFKSQERFDAYRRLYNHDRPHEALDLAVPASRYRPSPRAMPAHLPVAEYDSDELLRPVKSKGEITFLNRFYYVGRAFAGLNVALRPTATDGVYRLCYAAFTLGLIDCSLPSDLPKGHYHPLLPHTPNVLPSSRDTCYP